MGSNDQKYIDGLVQTYSNSIANTLDMMTSSNDLRRNRAHYDAIVMSYCSLALSHQYDQGMH